EQTCGMMIRIRGAGVRLYHLVENFQAYAQIEIMRSDPRRVERLRQMCTNNAELFVDSCVRNRSFDRPGDLRCHLEPAPKLAIAEEHLKKIIEELLDNAIKFSNQGTPILISGATCEDHYTIRFADHGRGMSDDEIARVGAYMQFERRIYEQQGSG